ncbi:MAG: methyltransferase [Marinosulfonomonas sp.]|nr:methyltransferase [Marinosulfonomonas sp.]
MGFDDGDLTLDDFLGGLVKVFQPKNGHRAGIDPVLLAAAVDAVPGDTVLELGCGSGVASLCLARRVGGIDLVGAELQAKYAELARKNSVSNGIPFAVFACDIVKLPIEIRTRSFSHVIANPPYFRNGGGTATNDPGRNLALSGDIPMRVWVDVATRRLAPGGKLTFIQKADRLADLLSGFDDRLGSVTVKPITPRAGRRAELVIVHAQKGSRGDFQLLSPLVLHEGASHDGDRDSYTPEIRNVLRHGGSLSVD